MSTPILYGIIAILVAAIVFLALKLNKYHQRYSGIIDLDSEMDKVRSGIEREVSTMESTKHHHQRQMAILSKDYSNAKSL